MPTGSLKKVFREKGFGFITPDDGTADIFAPVRTLVGPEENLREGLKVIFEFEVEARTNKPKATTWSVMEGQITTDPAAAAAAAAAYSGMAGYSQLLTAQYGAITGGMLGADRLSPYGAMYGALGTMPLDASGLAAATGGLPAGWEAVSDPSSGKVYYANRATGESSWTPPMAAMTAPLAMTMPATSATAPAASTEPAAAAAPAAALPAGWETALDPSSGKSYYFNRATNETSWTPPPQ